MHHPLRQVKLYSEYFIRYHLQRWFALGCRSFNNRLKLQWMLDTRFFSEERKSSTHLYTATCCCTFRQNWKFLRIVRISNSLPPLLTRRCCEKLEFKISAKISEKLNYSLGGELRMAAPSLQMKTIFLKIMSGAPNAYIQRHTGQIWQIYGNRKAEGMRECSSDRLFQHSRVQD